MTAATWIALGMASFAWLSMLVGLAVTYGRTQNRIDTIAAQLAELKAEVKADALRTETIEGAKWDQFNFKMGQLSRLVK